MSLHKAAASLHVARVRAQAIALRWCEKREEFEKDWTMGCSPLGILNYKIDIERSTYSDNQRAAIREFRLAIQFAQSHIVESNQLLLSCLCWWRFGCSLGYLDVDPWLPQQPMITFSVSGHTRSNPLGKSPRMPLPAWRAWSTDDFENAPTYPPTYLPTYLGRQPTSKLGIFDLSWSRRDQILSQK